MDIESIPYAETNPKIHDVDGLARSLERYGAVETPTLNETTGRLVAGHGRIDALRELKRRGANTPKNVRAEKGRWYAPVLRGNVFANDAEASAYLVDANALTLAGSELDALEMAAIWEQEEYAQLLAGLAEQNALPVAVSLDDYNELLKEWGANERAELTDVAELVNKADELQKKWKVQRGDIWSAGKHRLMCGDSTSEADYAALMGTDKAKLCVTSPPYGVGKSYEKKGIAPWFETMRPAIRLMCKYAEVCVYNIGDLYATGGQFIEPTFAYSTTMFAEAGFKPIWIRMWLKQGINYGIGAYHLVSNKPAQQYEYLGAFGADDGAVPQEQLADMDDFEWVLAFANAKFKYVKRLSQAERRAWGYAGVWQMNTVRANKDHPAMFPIELPTRAIKMHSDAEDVVLEPFNGSGTTLAACELLGRQGRGMELDPKFCAVTLERLKELGLKPERRVAGKA